MDRTPIEMMIDQACGCDVEAVCAEQERDQQCADALLILAEAAKRWWIARNPHVLLDEHLAHPLMNCFQKSEKDLALAVANLLKLGW